jgi:hypothetical protein
MSIVFKWVDVLALPEDDTMTIEIDFRSFMP